MGFSWGGLGKALLGGAGIAAAPFTGGASLPLTFSSVLKSAAPALIGSVASGLAGGKQKGREAENAAAQDAASFAQRENAAKEAGMFGRAGVDLQRREFQQQSQGDAYRKAMQSAVAKNVQDVHVNRPAGVPTISYSGGLRPSAMGTEGRAAAGELNKQAMLKLMNGEQFDALPGYQGTAAPEFKKPGAMENILGGVGLGANALNTAMGAAEDRNNMQKYIEAIQALSKQQPPPYVGDGVTGVPDHA